jgi:hypothetical protein
MCRKFSTCGPITELIVDLALLGVCIYTFVLLSHGALETKKLYL